MMDKVQSTLRIMTDALKEIRSLQDAIDDNLVEHDVQDIRRIRAKANRIQEVAINLRLLKC